MEMINKIRFFLLIFFVCVSDILFAQDNKCDEWYLKGVAHYESGNYQISIRFLDSALSKCPDEDIFLYKAKNYYQLKEYEHSLESCLEANNFKNGIANYWIAKNYAMMDRVELAIENLKKNQTSYYRVPYRSIQQDNAFNDIRTSQEWNEFVRGRYFDEIDHLLLKVEDSLLEKDTVEAFYLLNKIIAQDERKDDAFYLRSQLFFQSSQFDDALDDINKSLKVRSKEIYREFRCLILLKLGEYEKGINELEKLYRRRPDKLYLLKHMGEGYMKMKDYPKSITAIETYLTFFPEEYDARIQKIKILFDGDQLIDALLLANEMLEQDKSNPVLFELRGDIYFKSGMHRYALSDYLMAISLDYKQSVMYYKTGLTKLKMGDRLGACKDWYRSGELNNRNAVEMILKYCND